MLPIDQLRAAIADRYRVEREIGQGGMATVYLARDLKHDREVALKVLRPELGAVLGPERFLSEISVTAKLRHPHLLPLFDSGSASGLLFYVMPFVAGESLRARLDREKQLPADEAVRIGVAVASALEHAHRSGVVHRDLKPENILLQDGQPVVADFGIALAVTNAGGARITQTGLSLGTPHYMSPEQAAGDRAPDARSDVYSLGAVVYEMLTGEPPHTGSTVQSIVAKVLTERPRPVGERRDTVPEHVDAAIMCALAKLPADRFASAKDFADALSGARTVAPPRHATRAQLATPRSRWTRLAPVLTWTPVVILAAVMAPGALRREEPIQTFPVHFPITDDSVSPIELQGITLAISRNGSKIAFVGQGSAGRGIYVRSLDSFASTFVRGTVAGLNPEFSPDGTRLLFMRNNELVVVPVAGGAPVVVTDTAFYGSWADNDEILYVRGERVHAVAPDGSGARVVAHLDSASGFVRFDYPHALPGGRAALVTLLPQAELLDGAQVGVLDTRSGKVTALGLLGTNPRYVRSGHILVARPDGTLFAAPFSLRRLQLTGPEEPVLQNVALGSRGTMRIAVSRTGTAVYQVVEDTVKRHLVAVDRQGNERVLFSQAARIAAPSLDPTGRRVAFTIGPARDPYFSDVWTYDLVTGTPARLTFDSISRLPTWMPDGRRVVYLKGAPTDGELMTRPWDGTGVEELLGVPGNVGEISIGYRGRYLAVRRGADNSVGGGDILIAPLDTPHALEPFVATPQIERVPAVSPDGTLLAYVSGEPGRLGVYVRPLGRSGAAVSVSGDAYGLPGSPAWSPDGRELFFQAGGRLIAATIAQVPDLAVTARETLFAVDAYDPLSFDVVPGAREFLMVRSPRRYSRGFFGIVNWTDELARRAAGASAASRN